MNDKKTQYLCRHASRYYFPADYLKKFSYSLLMFNSRDVPIRLKATMRERERKRHRHRDRDGEEKKDIRF